MRSQTYVCPVCSATRTLYAHSSQSTREFEEEAPDEVPCPRSKCKGIAKP